MRVLVTGGTGFVGAWSAKAAADAGHQVRLLVRTPEKLARSAAALGVDVSDYVVGDMTDHVSVEKALDGCDAVIHCAALVATDRKRAAEMLESNLSGAHNVIGLAVDAGLDPVVHVSSFSALFRPGLAQMNADLPVVGGQDGYGRSKAAVDLYTRELQAGGAPVVVTYPGMVMGPPAGEQFGEVAVGVESLARYGVIPTRAGGWVVVDVRDLAQLHATLLQPGLGPRRYMAGGRWVPSSQIALLMSQACGRRFLVAPIPGSVLRGLGRAVDLISLVLPFNSVLTEAGMEYHTRMPTSDDSPSERELGITYRDTLQTFMDTVDGLVACGRVPAGKVRR